MIGKRTKDLVKARIGQLNHLIELESKNVDRFQRSLTISQEILKALEMEQKELKEEQL